MGGGRGQRSQRREEEEDKRGKEERGRSSMLRAKGRIWLTA